MTALWVLRLLRRVPWYLYVIGTLLVLLGVQRLQNARVLEREHASSLTLLNEQAAHDTTRRTLLGYHRLIIQQVQREDSVDRELRQSRVLVGTLTAQLAGRKAQVDGLTVVLGDSSTRVSGFVIDEAPMHMQLRVISPVPPNIPTAQYSIAYDPVPMSFRIGCGNEYVPNTKLRAATMTVSGPPWMTVQLGEIAQEESVCNAGRAAQPFGKQPNYWKRGVIGTTIVGSIWVLGKYVVFKSKK